MKPYAVFLLAILPTLVRAQSDVTSVTNLSVIESQTRDFEKSLKPLGFEGHLQCSRMIELHPKHGRDISYGAFCEFGDGEKKRNIMVCDDTMIGRFTVKLSGYALTDEVLRSFTETNCPGGG